MKFIIDNIFLFGLAILSGGALLFPYLQQRGNKLNLLQATQLINQKLTIILDVREPALYAAGHIRDAKNFPIKELSKRVAELEKFKTRAILVVCQSGTQSGKAVAELTKAGFNEVHGLAGGMTAWQAQSMPVVTSTAAIVKGA